MSLVNTLKDLGLSDKEAKVYIAMLELGASPVQEIAAKAGINRPTTYLQIESLKKHGLISTQKKGKKDLYIAESPDQLEAMMTKEKKVLEGRAELLKKSLPEFMQLFATAGDRPTVRYFEGKEGLLRMQQEFLKCKSGLIRAMANLDNVKELFPNQKSDYTEKRISKRIRARAIYTSREGKVKSDSDESMLREARYIPFDSFPFDSDITIYDNTVAIASLKGQVGGLLIDHQSIADSFKSLFDFIWKLSEKI
jgi:HTH-type transcriptional regulator, sugar sensing transcriptional regulator